MTRARARAGRGIAVATAAALAVLVASCVNLAPAVTATTGGTTTGEITMADINGDGRADAIVAGDEDAVYWFDRCEDDSCLNLEGSAEAAPGIHDLASGDLNGDGTADVVIATDSGIEVMPGRASGLVRGDSYFVTTGVYQHLIVADLDHDGHLDIGAANATGYDLFVNEGDGSFKGGPRRLYTVVVPSGYFAAQIDQLASGDFDGNGQPEGLLAIRAITNTGAIHTVYLALDQTTITSFQEIVDSLTGQIGVGDLNGDGHDDVAQFSAAGSAIDVSLWAPGGSAWPTPGTFTADASSIPVSFTPNTVRLADLDADQKVDIIVGQPNGLSYWQGDGLGGVMVVGGATEFDHAVPGVTSFELAHDTHDPRPNIVASLNDANGTIAFIDDKP
jgi:hypothetical protein